MRSPVDVCEVLSAYVACDARRVRPNQCDSRDSRVEDGRVLAEKRGVFRAFCAYTSVFMRATLANDMQTSGIALDAGRSKASPEIPFWRGRECIRIVLRSASIPCRTDRRVGPMPFALLRGSGIIAGDRRSVKAFAIHRAATGAGDAHHECLSIFRSVVDNVVECSRDDYRPCYSPRPDSSGSA